MSGSCTSAQAIAKPLRLSSGQVLRAGAGLLGQSDPFEPLLGPSAGHVVQRREGAQLLQGGQPFEERRRLQLDAHSFAAAGCSAARTAPPAAEPRRSPAGAAPRSSRAWSSCRRRWGRGCRRTHPRRPRRRCCRRRGGRRTTSPGRARGQREPPREQPPSQSSERTTRSATERRARSVFSSEQISCRVLHGLVDVLLRRRLPGQLLRGQLGVHGVQVVAQGCPRHRLPAVLPRAARGCGRPGAAGRVVRRPRSAPGPPPSGRARRGRRSRPRRGSCTPEGTPPPGSPGPRGLPWTPARRVAPRTP